MTFPIDVLIDEYNVFGPDLLWCGTGRSPSRAAAPPCPVPDPAVEARSPSTWRYDIGAKKNGYERNGLPELWLVDTSAYEIIVFRRSSPKAASFDVALELERGDTLSSQQLPGLTLPLDALFHG